MESTKTSVGTSGITPFKQEDIQHLLSKQIGNAAGVYLKCHKKYFYNNDVQNCFIDCSAGNMNLNCKTSPFTFITTLRKFEYYPSKLFLIEKCKDTFCELEANFKILNERSNYNVMPSLFREDYVMNDNRKDICKVPPEIKILRTDMSKFLYSLSHNRYRYGLLYFDPNGFTLDDYIAIFDFINGNQSMDIIININVTQIARNRGVKKIKGFDKYHNVDLTILMAKFNQYKKTIYIRNNINLEQHNHIDSTNKFVLLFGTNNPNFIMPGTYNFVQLNSKCGQDVINKYNYNESNNAI